MSGYNQHSDQDFSGSQIFGSNYNSSFQNTNNQQNTFSSVIDDTVDDQKKSFNEAGLLSCTIQQIMNADEPDPEQPFVINGKIISQLLLIARVQNIQSQSTHTEYIVRDDTTGDSIKVKYWLSDNDISNKQNINSGDLIKVFGRIDLFNGSRSINAHRLMNNLKPGEIQYHMFEVQYASHMNVLLSNVHLPDAEQSLAKFHSVRDLKYNQGKAQFQRHLQTVSNSSIQQSPNMDRNSNQNRNYTNIVNNNNNNNTYQQQQQQQRPLFNRSPYRNENTFNNSGSGSGYDNISMVERSNPPPIVIAVYKVLESAQYCQRPNGVHINDIAKHTFVAQYTFKEIQNTCKELNESGMLYTTVSEKMYKKTN